MNATAGAWRRARSTAVADQLVEPQLLVRLAVRLAVARQLDQIADQLAELLDLGDEVGPQALAIGLGQRARRAQDLEVGAQRSERRAQLVRGVGHEPALGRCESSSASSMVLNEAARRASSSSPCASMRRDRSRVRATCSAVSVRSVTGRTA